MRYRFLLAFCISVILFAANEKGEICKPDPASDNINYAAWITNRL